MTQYNQSRSLWDRLFNTRRSIPRNIFVQDPEEQISSNGASITNEIKPSYSYDLSSSVLGLVYGGNLMQGIDSVHLFISLDFETKGYKDALTNPDGSNLESNLKILFYDLCIVTERALTFYDDQIKKLEVHIKMREDNGLTDLASELNSERLRVEELILKVKEIERDAIENKGKSQRIMLSYDTGFKKGLRAITEARIFGKNIDK